MKYKEEIEFLKKKLDEQHKLNKQNEDIFNESLQATCLIKKMNASYSLIKCNKAFLNLISESIKLPYAIEKLSLSNKSMVKNISNAFAKEELLKETFEWEKNSDVFRADLKKLSDSTVLLTITRQHLSDVKAKADSIPKNSKVELEKGRFKSVFHNAPIAIVLVDKKVKPSLCNEQFCKMTGFTQNEILKMNLKDLSHPDDYKSNAKLYQQLFNNEITNFTLTKRYLRKDKKFIWVKVTVSATKNENNLNESAIVMVQDISAEKKATTELIKSEYKYRTLIENANDGIGLFDIDFKPILYNTSLYEALGFDVKTYLKFDHSKYELFHPDDAKEAKSAFENVKKGNRSRIEKRLRHKDGSYRYFSISYIPVVHEDQPAALIFRRDISKRKEAEAQNEEYRLFLETLMDNLPVALFAKTTPDFRYQYWNKTIERLTGISADDAIGSTDFELSQFKKDAERYSDEDKKILRKQEKIENEYSFTNALGETKQFRSIKTIHTPSVGKPMILGIAVDVTQLREAENMVEQSSHIIKEAQKIAKLGYWEYDVQKNLLFDNIENRQILGTQKLTYFLNFKQFLNIIHPADREIVTLNFENCIKNKIEGEGIIKVQNKDQIKHLSINYKPIIDQNGEVSKVRGTTIDITRIRSSEMALKESEYKLKQAEHIAKVGYWNYDYEKNETQFSDEVWNLLDLKRQTKAINFIDFFNNVHPDDKAYVNTKYLKHKNQNKPFDFDFRIISSQNKTKHIKAKGVFVINKLKKPVRSIGIFQDITLLKEKEIALEHSAKHLIEVQKLSKTGYIEIQYTDNTTVFSDTIWDIIERPKNSIKEHTEFTQLIIDTDRNTIEKTLEQTFKNGGSHNLQYRIKLENGTIKHINEICIIGEHKYPKHKYATRVLQDITTIKEQDLALQQSKTDLDKIKKTNEMGFWEFNLEKKTFYLSKELQSLLNLNKDTNPIPYKKLISLIHPNDQFSVKKILSENLKKKEDYTLTYRLINVRNANTIYIRDKGNFVKNDMGEWVLKGLIKDVTDSKLKEIKFLESKDLLNTLIDNPMIANFIYQNNKIIYQNKKWISLIGNSYTDKKNLDLIDVLEESTTNMFMSLFAKWDSFKMNEYNNTLQIEPLKSKPFTAEVYVREILSKGIKSYIVSLYCIDNQ